MQRSIIIIDDDIDLAAITSDLLRNYGYEVVVAHSGEDAYDLLAMRKFDLILLDINLPTESGFEICKEIRKISTVPLIFASARTSEDDRVVGLDLGGDDYLPKPYSLKELLSRVNALMRRTYGFQKEEEVYCFDDIDIHSGTRTVKKNGEVISLSLKEFDLLLYLVRHKNEILAKEKILSEVWGLYSEVEVSTVAVHIRWLREKLEDNPSKPKWIKTVWGIGYRFENEYKKL